MKPKTEQEVIDLLTTITSSNVGGVPMWIYHNATALLKSINSDNTELKVLKSNVSPLSEVEKSFWCYNESILFKGKCNEECFLCRDSQK